MNPEISIDSRQPRKKCASPKPQSKMKLSWREEPKDSDPSDTIEVPK